MNSEYCERLQDNYDAMVWLMSELIRGTSTRRRDHIVNIECRLNLPDEANYDIRATLRFLDTSTDPCPGVAA